MTLKLEELLILVRSVQIVRLITRLWPSRVHVSLSCWHRNFNIFHPLHPLSHFSRTSSMVHVFLTLKLYTQQVDRKLACKHDKLTLRWKGKITRRSERETELWHSSLYLLLMRPAINQLLIRSRFYIKLLTSWIPSPATIVSCCCCWRPVDRIGLTGLPRLASRRRYRPCEVDRSWSTGGSARTAEARTWFLCRGRLSRHAVYFQSNRCTPGIAPRTYRLEARMRPLCRGKREGKLANELF